MTLWESYRDCVYGEELPATQEKECGKAFYAGMMAGFVDLLKISNDSEEEDAVEKVEAFRELLLEEAASHMKVKNPS